MSDIDKVPPSVLGTPITVSKAVPDDKIILIGGQIIMSPLGLFRVRYGNRPLWTRHMLGVSEAERDQRRYPR